MLFIVSFSELGINGRLDYFLGSSSPLNSKGIFHCLIRYLYISTDAIAFLKKVQPNSSLVQWQYLL